MKIWSMEASSLDVAELAPVVPGLWRHKVLNQCLYMTDVWLVERWSGSLVRWFRFVCGVSNVKQTRSLLINKTPE